MRVVPVRMVVLIMVDQAGHRASIKGVLERRRLRWNKGSSKKLCYWFS